jgi:hypothetical protein
MGASFWAVWQVEEMIKGLRAGKSYAQVGKDINRSESAVRAKAVEAGVRSTATSKVNTGRPRGKSAKAWSAADSRALMEMADKGVSLRDIAAALGKSYGAVHTQRQKLVDGMVALDEAPEALPPKRRCIGAFCQGRKQFQPAHKHQFMCGPCRGYAERSA